MSKFVLIFCLTHGSPVSCIQVPFEDMEACNKVRASLVAQGSWPAVFIGGCYATSSR